MEKNKEMLLSRREKPDGNEGWEKEQNQKEKGTEGVL